MKSVLGKCQKSFFVLDEGGCPRERSLRVFSFLLPVSALLHGGPKYLLVEKDANFGCLSSLLSHLLSTLDKLYRNNFGRIYLSGRSQWTLDICTGTGQRIKIILLAVGVMIAMFWIVMMILMKMMTKTVSSQEWHRCPRTLPAPPSPEATTTPSSLPSMRMVMI